MAWRHTSMLCVKLLYTNKYKGVTPKYEPPPGEKLFEFLSWPSNIDDVIKAGRINKLLIFIKILYFVYLCTCVCLCK